MGWVLLVMAFSVVFCFGWAMGAAVTLSGASPEDRPAADRPAWDRPPALHGRLAGGTVPRTLVATGPVAGTRPGQPSPRRPPLG